MFKLLKSLFSPADSNFNNDLGDVGDAKTYIRRMGRSIEADEVFFAWTSENLDRMILAATLDTNPIDRHFLLSSIVKETYRRRKEPKMRECCINYGERHLAELKDIIDPLKKDMDGTLPRISTFQYLSTIYTEDGDFSRAIEICEKAIKIDLHDGTASGFEGRIERIKKKNMLAGRS